MALRARLTAPPPPPTSVWKYHTAKTGSVPVGSIFSVDRRMEAETYLSTGFGFQRAIRSNARDWTPFGEQAKVWMPGRLKGIQVSREYGTPFLAATQVYDLRPVPRKWLSLDRTGDAANRFVSQRTILVTCSGSVGRPTIAYAPHDKTLISHDLLRINPVDEKMRGWLYAYLHAPQVKAMAVGVHYGHIIKHLEPSHLESLPLPLVDESRLADFNERFEKIYSLRNKSYEDAIAAETKFADSLGYVIPKMQETAFNISASKMFGARRRLEGNYYTPIADAIRALFKESVPLREVAKKVWWLGRFRRFYGESGIPYMSADELFTINPIETKRILVDKDDGHEDYFVKRGWLLMACSGQVYGLNGAATIATEYDERAFFSHDLIRIIPDNSRIRAGYLLTAVTHPTHGRPLLIRAAYGTSIPHLDPGDVSAFPVVRMGKKREAEISDLMESSVAARAEADAMERAIAQDAGAIIDAASTSKLRLAQP